MAINAYTGLMGSGKSYEVVSSVIVPAIQAGRRVVTNIDGINPQAIEDYILARTKLTADDLGEIVTFTNDDIAAVNFFPSEADPHSETNDTILKAGDLLAVDECWKFWSTDNKITDAHMTFFRMHRHYTHPVTGIACDVALMIQDLGTLHRKLRAVVEISTRTVKLKTLGMDTKYRIELYEGNKLTQKSRIDTFNKSYKAEIFPLYKSYAAGEGKENAMDKRQNVLLNPRNWIIFPILFVFGIWGFWWTLGYFNGKSRSTNSSNAPSSALTQLPIPSKSKPDYSTDWRIAGRFDANGQNWTVLVNSAGKFRVESPSVFSNSGYAVIGEIDGQKTTVWTGAASGGLFSPPPPSPPAPSQPPATR
jgi:zona occludens toxin